MGTIAEQLARALATCAAIVRVQNGNLHDDTTNAVIRANIGDALRQADDALTTYDAHKDAVQRDADRKRVYRPGEQG